MIKNHDLIDRFFRYVKIDTQSAEDTGTQPSTAKQHDLAKLLYKELHEMGVEAHYDRKNCYVYAKLPGEEPAIGFIAHMDTSPAASGANVHPRIEENYQGHSIVLFKGHAGSESIVMRHEAFPELQNHIGEDLIVTDGKTLLGADDKAGIAEIMNLLAYYTSHPELPHRTICVAFTPDEEIGGIYRRRQQTRRDRIRVFQRCLSACGDHGQEYTHRRRQKRDAQRCFGRHGV